jgi:steroid Delta-isomerase
MMLHLQKPAEDYISFFQTLTPRSLPLIVQHVSEDVVFRDPFHDVRGIEQMKKIFNHMFETCDHPRFTVIDHAYGKDGMTVYLKWRFTAGTKIGALDFIGVSEVTFDPKGKVASHVDFWDSSAEFYSKISILRPFFTFLRRKASA